MELDVIILPLPFRPVARAGSPTFALGLGLSGAISSSKIPTLGHFIVSAESDVLFPPFGLCFSYFTRGGDGRGGRYRRRLVVVTQGTSGGNSLRTNFVGRHTRGGRYYNFRRTSTLGREGPSCGA